MKNNQWKVMYKFKTYTLLLKRC